MTSSSRPTRTAVLRGGVANSRPARMNADLVSSPFATGRFSDARLVDPVLEQVVADASAQAVAAGHAEGFTQGYAEGTARAAAESAAELAVLRDRLAAEHQEQLDRVTRSVTAVEAALRDLEARTAPAAAEVERLALAFAVDIAAALLGRELTLSASPALDAVRRALSLAPVDTDLLVRLNPADADVVAEAARAAAPGRTVEVVADTGVEVGGCIVDAGACHIDAQLGPALERVRAALAAARPAVTGRVTRAVGLSIEIAGLSPAVGDAVHIESSAGQVLAEVVAVRDDGAVCMPVGDVMGIRCGAPVTSTGGPMTVPVGAGLLGRVVDALGRPLDGGPELRDVVQAPLEGAAPHPLSRARVDQQLGLGVRAMDTLIPVGRGQRIGVFAGSGVGKSSLLSMIARGTDAQVSVLALIGERGREVREFIENDLGPEGLARSVVVVATSDQPPLVRLRAAFTATRIAEGFRDAGQDVVLMMDSLTRCAMAQREVGLSAGEPPATRGYPPSVFALLPRLLERAGTAETGSITGIYTVLVEGDDMNEPIGDAARSILDGHVVLTRQLATAGHFPSIDVLESVSRVANAVTTREQRAAGTELRRLLAAKRDAKDLVEIGAYAPGSNPLVDRALALGPATDAFLQQDIEDVVSTGDSWAALAQLVGAA